MANKPYLRDKKDDLTNQQVNDLIEKVARGELPEELVMHGPPVTPKGGEIYIFVPLNSLQENDYSRDQYRWISRGNNKQRKWYVETQLQKRFVDLVCRRLSVGNVLWSEKSPPENKGTGKPSAEAEDKTPHKEESSKPPEPDALAALLSGMKVEVTSKKKFQAIKKKNPKLQSQENADNIESASRMFQMVAEESHPEEKPVNKELSDAASAVASTYPSQQKQVESELLQQLRLHKQMAEEIRRKGSDNISKVISGMKVKKQSPKTGKQMSAEEREFMRNASKKSLHTGKRLRIFPVSAPTEALVGTEMPPTLWDLELVKEIAYIFEHPPRNGFEEMIQWTKEGKLWSFPIDNEAGLDEEQKVEFHEHIFLENYLEDFPKHGPIRHFMELVICGLSKNPYLTVQQKKDHIDWFHDYFHKKEDLLRECDVYIN